MTTQIPLPETNEVEAIRLEFAARTGADPDQVRGVRLQLDTLRRQGVLVDLDIAGLSMFARSADWLELGIDEDDVRRDRFTRGQKYLIPEEQIKRLRSVESQMRQALEHHSYRVAGFAPYRWVPYTAYDEFVQAFANLVERFETIKTDILEHYDDYVDLLADDFSRVAAEAWRSFKARAGRRALQVVIGGQTFEDLDAFTDCIVRRALERMPSQERIQRDLQADYATLLVYAAQDLAADELAAANIRHEIERQDEELAHEARLHQMEIDAQRAKIQAMRDAEAEHARRRLEEMTSPFEEVFADLRARIAADARLMLESLRKNNHLRGKVAEKGRGLLDLYELLAAHNDYELRDTLLRLKAAIGPVAPERDVDEIASLLDQVIDLSHAAAKDVLTGSQSRFAILDQ
jgi:hypothetical protein